MNNLKKLVKNQLGYDLNLFVYQDKSMFNYSIDTILLGNFMTINPSVKKILEVGTNNGALSIFISERSEKVKIDALEIQEDAIDIAKYNIKINNKEKQINVIHEDFNFFWKKHNKAQEKKYDSIVCNPPFYKVNTGHVRKGSNAIYVATHEIKLSLEQLILGASKLLKQKGYLAIVEPTERLVDIFEFMRKYGFEPKRVQLVYPRENTKSNLVLVEARFKTGWGTNFLQNIYLHSNDLDKHEYREEVIKLYKPLKYNKGVKNDK